AVRLYPGNPQRGRDRTKKFRKDLPVAPVVIPGLRRRTVVQEGESPSRSGNLAMPENESAVELFQRVRGGDGAAAAELVRRYEPAIRRRVRVWLRLQDPRLRRVFDSMDICQSVLASFFVRAAAGQYELQDPGQLIALLFRMAQHKLAHQVARQ